VVVDLAFLVALDIRIEEAVSIVVSHTWAVVALVITVLVALVVVAVGNRTMASLQEHLLVGQFVASLALVALLEVGDSFVVDLLDRLVEAAGLLEVGYRIRQLW
jgi:uncharacterized membrane protein YjfL (UPF0719 family)